MNFLSKALFNIKKRKSARNAGYELAWYLWLHENKSRQDIARETYCIYNWNSLQRHVEKGIQKALQEIEVIEFENRGIRS